MLRITKTSQRIQAAIRNLDCTVVIAHHNKPFSVINTLLRFSLLSRMAAQFVIIDNGSSSANVSILKVLGPLLVARIRIERRENLDREAGAYWHYIQNTFRPSRVTVFLQDQAHRRGMIPSNVPKWFSPYNSRFAPYYPGRLRVGELDLVRVEKLLSFYPEGLLGFGGKRCAQGIDSDLRFKTSEMIEAMNQLSLDFFDFFSGACFAVSRAGFAFIKQFENLSEYGKGEPHYAHFWERLWGSIFSTNGLELIDFHSGSTNVWHSIGVAPDDNGRWWATSIPITSSRMAVRGRLKDFEATGG